VKGATPNLDPDLVYAALSLKLIGYISFVVGPTGSYARSEPSVKGEGKTTSFDKLRMNGLKDEIPDKSTRE
jgi:hypothetical protein